MPFVSGSVRAETLDVRYGIALAGIPIGVASLTGAVDGQQYTLDVNAQLIGLAKILAGGQGAATANGFVGGEKLRPVGYAITSSNGKDTRTIRMGMQGGHLSALSVDPPFDERSDRVPVLETHKRGILDPVSSLVMPMQGTDPLSAAQCTRSLPVFDGLQRFDVNLTYDRVTTLKGAKDRYSGPVVVCKATYVPLAGYRPSKREVQYMQRNRDMEVWLVPLVESRVLVPYKITVKTQFGTASIESQRCVVGGTKTASRQRS
jgi:hypothetical protein